MNKKLILSLLITFFVLVLILISGILFLNRPEETEKENIEKDLTTKNLTEENNETQTPIEQTYPQENQKNNQIYFENQKLEITFKTYSVEAKNEKVNIDKSKIQNYNPLEIKKESSDKIIFVASEQIISVDLKDPYILKIIEDGANKVKRGEDIYEYSKEIFSSLNLDKYNYWQKMEEAVKKGEPISLSELAKNKVGVCLEQSIFRILAYAYAGQGENYKMIILAPPQGSNDSGHATVKRVEEKEEKIIENFLATELYSWEIAYIEVIQIKKD